MMTEFLSWTLWFVIVYKFNYLHFGTRRRHLGTLWDLFSQNLLKKFATCVMIFAGSDSEMISKLAKSIAHFFVVQNITEESKEVIYAYGMELLISDVLNTASPVSLTRSLPRNICCCRNSVQAVCPMTSCWNWSAAEMLKMRKPTPPIFPLTSDSKWALRIKRIPMRIKTIR